MCKMKPAPALTSTQSGDSPKSTRDGRASPGTMAALGTPAPPGTATTPGTLTAPESQRRRRALLGILGEFLESAAGPLLIGTSVYREPADRNAVLFQVGLPDWAAARAPDTQGPTPPHRAPANLTKLTAACVHAGLLGMTSAETATGSVPTLFVDRWIATELHKFLAAMDRHAELADAHLRAAEYWQWRAAAWPQGRHADIHDLLEARQHLLHAGDIAQVNGLTGVICAQLRAWGDLDHETELIQATLDALPAPSADRARWLLELAAIAQAQGDLAAAETRYLQAAKMFVQVDETVGAAQGYESLGALAHAQGDYRKAERHRRAAADHRRNSSGPAEQPFASAGPLRLAEQPPGSAQPPFSSAQPPFSSAQPPPSSGQPPFGPAEPPAGLADPPSSPGAASAPAGQPRRLRRPSALAAGSLTLVALTVATAALGQAPGHSASFGTGSARIEVRRAMEADQRARQALAAGRLHVIGFGDSGPGADGGAPLRSAEVAVTGPGAGTAALGPLLAFLRAQRPPEPGPLGLLTGRP
jgi:tetratricopeptide (TPR) repeat protein